MEACIIHGFQGELLPAFFCPGCTVAQCCWRSSSRSNMALHGGHLKLLRDGLPVPTSEGPMLLALGVTGVTVCCQFGLRLCLASASRMSGCCPSSGGAGDGLGPIILACTVGFTDSRPFGVVGTIPRTPARTLPGVGVLLPLSVCGDGVLSSPLSAC